jgi:uncharacterized membrane protein
MIARKSMLVAVLLALVIPPLVQGQERSVREIVAEIKQAQGVERAEAIDPDEVSDATLEELGEALMSVMVPNERQHEFMDRMMGGEGSDSLEAMHRAMGYSYLAGDGRGSWDSGWSMMGRSRGPGPWMMGGPGAWGRMHGWGMMGGAWVWVLVAILAVAVIVLAVLLAARGRRSSPGARPGDSAREILAQRYARGEISREEYRQALEDIG